MSSEKKITMREYNGTDYDTLYPQTIASQVDGVYPKEEVLSSGTKTLYGLNDTAVPDDVLALIKTLIDNGDASANANANSRAKIATGSYVGTGTYYGDGTTDSPIYITVGFTPKLFIISEKGGRTLFAIGQNIGFCTAGTYVRPFANNNDTPDITTWGPTITLKGSYNTGAGGQFNVLNTTYYWVAIE